MENYEIENEEIKKTLKNIGRIVAKDLPEGWGFNLLIFTFGEGGSTFYISNAQREDAIKLLEEHIEKLKKQ